jgi:hypothetical protein
MKMVDGQRGKLLRILDRLEAGILVETTAAQALYIPAGCIHATFTMEGGYLIANNFTTSKSINAISAFIAAGLDTSLPSTAREVCFGWFERCLDVSLAHQQFNPVIKAWIAAESHLSVWASSHRQWRTNIRRLWEQYLDDNAQVVCSCGTQNPNTTISEHLFSTHLQFLLPPSQLRRHKRPKTRSVDEGRTAI